MSNTSTAKRLGRWFLINLVLATVICVLTGRYLDPWLWGFLATLALTTLYPALCLDADLARERFHPPDQGADRLYLLAYPDYGSGAHRGLLP